LVIEMRSVMRPVRFSIPKIWEQFTGLLAESPRKWSGAGRLFLRNARVPDSLSAEGTTMSMHRRFIALFALACFALSAAGCESLWKDPSGKHPKKKSTSKKEYKEVLMPLQTGSTLQRRTYVPVGPESDSTPAKKKKKEKEAVAPKPDAEPSATPIPAEESTPAPAERFR
jgi:hypothetical protein